MISDLIFLFLLTLGGITDLRHKRIKHWQISVFALFVLGHALVKRDMSLLILFNFLGVAIFGLAGFLINRVGAADVKVIALCSLYNFYHFNPWWVSEAVFLTAVIEFMLWGSYFRHRQERSPLLFAWMIAVVGLFIWWQFG